MSINDIVRAAVVKTNDHWPFSRLNRIPYHLAIGALLQLCKNFPQIRSVYLRHGLLEDDWVPAISDIDLTLVIRGQLPPEEEFSFLQSFWQAHDRLKKLFPMLRDIDILDEEHVGSWTRFTIRGYESSRWRLLYGVQTVESEYVPAPMRITVDALNYGLLFYLDCFLPKFYTEERENSVYLHELQRLTRKLSRLAHYSTSSDRRSLETDPPLRDKSDLLAWLVKALDEGMRYVAPAGRITSSANGARQWSDDVEAAASVDQVWDLQVPAVVAKAIDGVLRLDDRHIVVLRDDLDVSVIRSCADVVRRVFHQRRSGPVIVSGRLFEHMVRSYDPFLYARLATSRKLAYGRDVLRTIEPPDRCAFIGKVLGHLPSALAFPQKRPVIYPPGLAWLDGRGPEWLLEGALFFQLYLETGSVGRRREALVAETRERYGASYRRLRDIREQAQHAGTTAVAGDFFRLFKDLARDVHSQLADSAGLEDCLVRPWGTGTQG